jgi:uncharacterized protein
MMDPMADRLIEVKVTPRASRDEIVGMRDGVLAVRVTAPPVDDKANQAVVKLLAKRAGIPRGRVRIVRGQRGRRKLIAIDGAGREALERITG